MCQVDDSRAYILQYTRQSLFLPFIFHYPFYFQLAQHNQFQDELQWIYQRHSLYQVPARNARRNSTWGNPQDGSIMYFYRSAFTFKLQSETREFAITIWELYTSIDAFWDKDMEGDITIRLPHGSGWDTRLPTSCLLLFLLSRTLDPCTHSSPRLLKNTRSGSLNRTVTVSPKGNYHSALDVR